MRPRRPRRGGRRPRRRCSGRRGALLARFRDEAQRHVPSTAIEPCCARRAALGSTSSRTGAARFVPDREGRVRDPLRGGEPPDLAQHPAARPAPNHRTGVVTRRCRQNERARQRASPRSRHDRGDRPGRHGDPFAVLGPHPAPADGHPDFQPDAQRSSVVDRATDDVIGTLRANPSGGIVHGVLHTAARHTSSASTPAKCCARRRTPYSFPLLLGDLDVHLLARGTAPRSRPLPRRAPDDGSAACSACASRCGRPTRGASRSWATSTAGTAAAIPMRLRHGAGVWELFIPRLGPGALYKYEFSARSGEMLPLKADPVAWAAEAPPAPLGRRAYRAVPLGRREWMGARARAQRRDAPISIYEVHAASWLPLASPDDRSGWDMLAERLVPYVERHGLHACRAAADHGASVRRLLGLSAARPVRAQSRAWGRRTAFARFVDRCHARA